MVSALWDDGLLEKVDLGAMDAAETAAVVAAAGGSDAVGLYKRSSGNPLHLRLLLMTGGNDETLAAAIDRPARAAGRVRTTPSGTCAYSSRCPVRTW